MDNLRAFGDQVDRSNPQTTSWGKVKCSGECSSWYGSADHKAKIAPPCWGKFRPGDFLAIRALNWDDIIDQDDDDDNWADPGGASGGRSRSGDDNDNDDGESEEDTQGGEKRTGNGKGTTAGKGKRKTTVDGKGKGKGMGKGNSKVKGIVKYTPGGDDFSRADALQLQKELSEADLDTGS